MDAVMMTLKIIPITMNMMPKYKQFFALRGSSCRKIKNAIMPPIMPNNIGNKNQTLLLIFSGCDNSFT